MKTRRYMHGRRRRCSPLNFRAGEVTHTSLDANTYEEDMQSQKVKLNTSSLDMNDPRFNKKELTFVADVDPKTVPGNPQATKQ